MRNATIVCTLGPASDDEATIRELVDAGMAVARLNASHGDTDQRRHVVERVRSVDADSEATVSVMLDLPGPEIRTAPLDAPIQVETGTEVRFVAGETATPEVVGLSTALEGVTAGDTVLLDDGRIETVVRRVDDDGVVAEVLDGGQLGGRKGVNVPGVDLGLDVVTERDEPELALAAETGVDFVAASFVRDADDVYRVSEALEERGADVPVIAKIERADAVENLEEILEAAYGVMVARGDLGVECPLEEVPLIQKRIVRRSLAAGVPVITATEMLDSMVHERRPTRAEATDVANAVLDGTDAVMLSGETAVGDHPVRVVETMDRIVRDVEASDEFAETREQRVPAAGASTTDALARSARYLARDVGATGVVVASESGYTARKVAKYRPAVPVVAVTPRDEVRRRLTLSWGVSPRYADLPADGADAVIRHTVDEALDSGIVASGDTVVGLAGMLTEFEADTANTLKVHVAAATVASGRSVTTGRAVGSVFRTTDGDLTDAPEDAVVVVDETFDAAFEGPLDAVAAFVSARSGLTGYAAQVARELGVPMVSDAPLPADVEDGDTVTVDGERGVVYAGEVTEP
ncbi:pyruvate kinase [Halorarius halobius]|uniref:pyruvate kinase n=1 Tax=Halorarius halobius TaxID=2962671 RepID=UPI0020CE6050|nr:pyruvate kinase [Halorarius halobius]